MRRKFVIPPTHAQKNSGEQDERAGEGAN